MDLSSIPITKEFVDLFLSGFYGDNIPHKLYQSIDSVYWTYTNENIDVVINLACFTTALGQKEYYATLLLGDETVVCYTVKEFTNAYAHKVVEVLEEKQKKMINQK